MRAASAIRVAISGFILVLFVVAGAGWRWAGSHQSAAQATASRTVLALSILAGITGLVAVWRAGARKGPRS